MSYDQDTPFGGICPECGYTDGHNVRTCPARAGVGRGQLERTVEKGQVLLEFEDSAGP